MRVAIVSASLVALIVAATLVALMLGAWSAEAAAPIPPTCSPLDTQRHATIQSEGKSEGRSALPAYYRHCGSGRAVLRVGGTSFTIKGGNCTGPRASVRFGLWSNGVLPTKAFRLYLRPKGPWHIYPGRNTIVDGVVQLPGFSSLPHQGTAVFTKDLERATFSLGDPSRPRVTGSWTCGVKRSR